MVLISILVFLSIGYLLAWHQDLDPESLGMPRCMHLVLFGKPCPLCGGYTAFSAALRGDLALAWEANPFACLFLFTLLGVGAGLVICLLWPGSIKSFLSSRTLRLAALIWCAVLVFVLVFFWLIRL